MKIVEGLEKRISTDKLLGYIEWCEENGLDADTKNLYKYLKQIVGEIDFNKNSVKTKKGA